MVIQGLYIEDQQQAKDYLENIGYYRLSAYMHPTPTSKMTYILKEGPHARKSDTS